MNFMVSVVSFTASIISIYAAISPLLAANMLNVDILVLPYILAATILIFVSILIITQQYQISVYRKELGTQTKKNNWLEMTTRILKIILILLSLITLTLIFFFNPKTTVTVITPDRHEPFRSVVPYKIELTNYTHGIRLFVFYRDGDSKSGNYIEKEIFLNGTNNNILSGEIVDPNIFKTLQMLDLFFVVKQYGWVIYQSKSLTLKKE